MIAALAWSKFVFAMADLNDQTPLNPTPNQGKSQVDPVGSDCSTSHGQPAGTGISSQACGITSTSTTGISRVATNIITTQPRQLLPAAQDSSSPVNPTVYSISNMHPYSNSRYADLGGAGVPTCTPATSTTLSSVSSSPSSTIVVLNSSQLSHRRFSVPSDNLLLTGTIPPSVNTLASSMTGPSPSQMMQYQAMTSLHGMGMQHIGMGSMGVSHPQAAAATGMQEIQPTPGSMIRFNWPTIGMGQSQVSHMGMMREANLHSQMGTPQAHYMQSYNTMQVQPHLMRGHMGHTEVHAGQPTMASRMYPHTTSPHRAATISTPSQILHDHPSCGDRSHGVEPRLPVEEESRNQLVESKVGGDFEPHRSESQVSRLASDTLCEKSGIVVLASDTLCEKSEPNGANAIMLSEKDLVNLMQLLQKYSYQWNPIGLCLGFIEHELKTIFGMPKLFMGAPVSYLQELLSQWVQWPTADHPNHPTLRSLCAALRSSLVGLGSLAEEVEREMKQCTAGVALVKSNSDQDVASKIKHLEKQFKHLHRSIRTELKAKENITVEEFLHALTLLPMTLKKEYEEIIFKKLPSLRQEETISELFLHLNPLFSFLDYGLLQYIIEEFGSTVLRARMQTYCDDIHTFMSQTTVQQLIDYWPREDEIAPNVSKVIAKINKDPRSIKLGELDSLRREICIRARLSDVICALVSARPSESFIVVWRLPSILAPQFIDALKQTKWQSFFIEENINSLFVDELQLYSTGNIPAFGNELKQQYLVLSPTVSHAKWIASPTEKIFNLAMIQRERVRHGQIDDSFVRMTISGRIDDIHHMKIPIELENIFKGEDQQIILIEGAPGSGKSTLAIHICQRWGKGELFQQFTVVILVQLRDPAVQRAQTIADLLPVEGVEVAASQELATELVATNGRGVLWVLDGWDELPPHLQQNSIVRKLLPPKPSEEKLAELERDPVYSAHVARKCSKAELWIVYLQNNPVFRTQYYKDRLLNEALIIVTSRPISSGDLHPVVSSRIEVLGFTPEEQRQYFTECLKGDTKALEALLEKIQENPAIQSSCYIPLNAAMTVHYFKIKGSSLPSTEYEIFLTNVLHCIHYYFEVEGKGRELPIELQSLDDLSKSEAVKESFHCLCKLAYHGVMENKVTFSSSDLPQGSNTLNLLQSTESFLQSGKSVFFYFIHLSFQELLASFYIATHLPDSEQVSQFQQLFHQPRFVSVFRFYTAFTKLKTPGIDKIITEIISMRSESHLFSLLRCLYEAQDSLLCQFVAEKLETIYTRYFNLTPLDLFSMGYLISVSNTNVVKEVDLNSLGDCGVKILMKPIICGKGVGAWKLKLNYNNIHEEGAACIAEALQCSGVMNSLNLGHNNIGGRGLQSLAKALITNTTLVALDLYDCSVRITEENGPVITEMLQRNTTLKELDLVDNNISDTGMYFIAEGLKKNSALKCLHMNCINAQSGKLLAAAIAINTSLVELKLVFLQITKDSGPAFIDMFQQNKSLEKVSLMFVSKIGIQFIAGGLQQNSTLKILAITRSKISSSESKALSMMLTVNKTLTSMDLSKNQIGDEGAAHLAEALRKNESLQILALSSCNITDAGLASLADALQVNDSLTELNLEENYALTKKGVTYSETLLSRKRVKIHSPLHRDIRSDSEQHRLHFDTFLYGHGIRESPYKDPSLVSRSTYKPKIRSRHSSQMQIESSSSETLKSAYSEKPTTKSSPLKLPHLEEPSLGSTEKTSHTLSESTSRQRKSFPYGIRESPYKDPSRSTYKPKIPSRQKWIGSSSSKSTSTYSEKPTSKSSPLKLSYLEEPSLESTEKTSHTLFKSTFHQ